ncbi:hypothetical protein [Anabaena lutea]|uniref:ApeA N-terminal domain-containing protein n=1 Tax=Anabaena lutea FACHB-196 TaxID=2692881 RepID=A0ABR8FGI6_9NOST|nr:hypothetical protein [Anabaena lutea]MBD2569345.1 hypothetical protein [Anabaena lutea FACHB-196]
MANIQLFLMLYQITVKVEADSIYHHPYKLEVDHFILDVILNQDKVVEALNIAMRVNNYQGFLPAISSDIESQITQIELRDSSLYFLLIDLAQHIEALGSFWFGIGKIYWENPRRAWVAETPEEEHDLDLSLNHFQQDSYENKCYIEMEPEMLYSLIKNRHIHRNLVLPMSFYREGCNEFTSRRYTTSFINFYFYLDDLYGQGKTKNREVENLFKSSEHIRSAVEETMQIFQNENSENWEELKEFLKMEKKDFTVDGLIELIVQIRGNLSHFSQKSSKKKGHPLNQRDFRSVAFLMKSICVLTFTKLTTGEQPK